MIGLCLTKERHFRLALPLSTTNTGWGACSGGRPLLLLSTLPSMSAWASGIGLREGVGVPGVAALWFSAPWISALAGVGFQQFRESVRGQGLGEQVALCQVTAVAAQEAVLMGGLHTFCHSLQR